MARNITRHTHYTPEHFPELATAVLRALINHYIGRGLRLPVGQHLVLHRIDAREGEYIALLVHVLPTAKVVVHPIPMSKTAASKIRREGAETPYGRFALTLLERALAEGKISESSLRTFESYALERVATRRSEYQYPGIPEYPNPYFANKLLQEHWEHPGTFQLSDRVFVLDYRERDGVKSVHLVPYSPKDHGAPRLATVHPEGAFPSHTFSSDRVLELFEDARKQAHFRPRIREE